MVAKCLSARTSTLTRVLEVMLLFVELEQADKVTVSAWLAGSCWGGRCRGSREVHPERATA